MGTKGGECFPVGVVTTMRPVADVAGTVTTRAPVERRGRALTVVCPGDPVADFRARKTTLMPGRSRVPLSFRRLPGRTWWGLEGHDVDGSQRASRTTGARREAPCDLPAAAGAGPSTATEATSAPRTPAASGRRRRLGGPVAWIT